MLKLITLALLGVTSAVKLTARSLYKLPDGVTEEQAWEFAGELFDQLPKDIQKEAQRQIKEKGLRKFIEDNEHHIRENWGKIEEYAEKNLAQDDVKLPEGVTEKQAWQFAGELFDQLPKDIQEGAKKQIKEKGMRKFLEDNAHHIKENWGKIEEYAEKNLAQDDLKLPEGVTEKQAWQFAGELFDQLPKEIQKEAQKQIKEKGLRKFLKDNEHHIRENWGKIEEYAEKNLAQDDDLKLPEGVTEKQAWKFAEELFDQLPKRVRKYIKKGMMEKGPEAFLKENEHHIRENWDKVEAYAEKNLAQDEEGDSSDGELDIELPEGVTEEQAMNFAKEILRELPEEVQEHIKRGVEKHGLEKFLKMNAHHIEEHFDELEEYAEANLAQKDLETDPEFAKEFKTFKKQYPKVAAMNWNELYTHVNMIDVNDLDMKVLNKTWDAFEEDCPKMAAALTKKFGHHVANALKARHLS